MVGKRLVGVLAVVVLGAGCPRSAGEAMPAPLVGTPQEQLTGFLTGAPGALVLAHRGYHMTRAENSRAAFQAALDAGIDGVELDVVSAADGTPMVFHDLTLDRLTPVSGRVIDRTATELGLIRIKRGMFGLWRLSDERIPTLEAVLKQFGGQMILWIEVKSGEPRAKGLERRVGDLVTKHGLEATTIIASFSVDTVELLVAEFPRLHIAYETFDTDHLEQRFSHAQYPFTISFQYERLTPALGAWAGKRFRGVSVFTPNTKGAMRRALAAGATLIQTDRPKAAQGVLAEPPSL